MVELLTSGLTNQNHSKFLMPMYGTDLKQKRGVSHSFIILNPTFLGNEIIDSLINCISITNENISPYQSLLNPGVKETLTKKQRELDGIPVSESILNGWERLGFKDD